MEGGRPHPDQSCSPTRTSGLRFEPNPDFSTLEVDLVLGGGLDLFDFPHNVARLNNTPFPASLCHLCVIGLWRTGPNLVD